MGTVRCQSFVACVTTTTLQHHSPHLFDAFSYSRNAEQLQPSRLDFRSASKCLKQPPKPPPRLRVLEVTRRRRTPTLPSAASLHTCSLPMSNVRMSVRKTQASASVKSAKSLVIGGRLLVRSSVSHTKTRRPSTMPLPVMRMRTKQVIVSGR